MTGLFKETMAACIISLIFGALAIGLHRGAVSASVLQFVLLTALWAAVNVAVFSFIDLRKIKKINQLLQDCDLGNFLGIYQSLSKRRANKANKAMVQLNLASAYINTGNDAAAGQVLYGINRKHFPKGRAGDLYEFVYHNNFFAYLLDTGDLTGAARALEQMGEIQQARELSAAKNPFPGLYEHQQYVLNVKNGIYEGAELFFSEAAEKHEHKINRVAAKYTLGKIYLHQGRPDQAALAFEYVIEHGGSTIYRVRAAERLEALGRFVCLPLTQMPPVKVFSTAEKAALAFYCGLVICVALFALVSAVARLL